MFPNGCLQARCTFLKFNEQDRVKVINGNVSLCICSSETVHLNKKNHFHGLLSPWLKQFLSVFCQLSSNILLICWLNLEMNVTGVLTWIHQPSKTDAGSQCIRNKISSFSPSTPMKAIPWKSGAFHITTEQNLQYVMQSESKMNPATQLTSGAPAVLWDHPYLDHACNGCRLYRISAIWH